jgi:hypothetical protein
MLQPVDYFEADRPRFWLQQTELVPFDYTGAHCHRSHYDYCASIAGI